MWRVKCGWLVYLVERFVRGIGPSVSCLRGVMFVEGCICGGSFGDGLFTLWGVLFVGCHVCGGSHGDGLFTLWSVLFVGCHVCGVSCLRDVMSHVDSLLSGSVLFVE